MAEIRAFSALRYAATEDLPRLTCPPYDVLSPQKRQALLERSPYATARLILPEGEGDAKYETAATLYQDWQGSDVLVSDSAPAFYVTRTTFIVPGTNESQRRLGLVCLLRLYDYADKIVLPHEKTLDRPKEDRLKLLRATQGNIESIMCLVDDANGELYVALKAATESTPLADFIGDDNQQHELFAISDPALIAHIEHLATGEKVYIADGHHRYETSVAYACETDTLSSDAPEAYLLSTLSTFSDPGLVVLPTHRLVRGVSLETLENLQEKLAPYFEVEESSLDALEKSLREMPSDTLAFGLLLSSGAAYLLTPRADALATALPAELSPSLSALDVVVLQYLGLSGVLGIAPGAVATTDQLAYTRDVAEAAQRVYDGEFDLAFLLGSPPVTGVRDVSLAGEVMPQKSTFFYPKLLSGLVMRKF